MKCKICREETTTSSIDTYKHKWYFCKNCKNIYSEKKKNVDSKLKKKLIYFFSKITNQDRLKKLLLDNDISGDEFYNYTGDIPKDGGSHFPTKDSIFNKWSKYDKDFIKYLNDQKIDLNSKSILSISDEPGLIVEELEKYTSRENITLTAFDKKTALFMSEKLKCKVLKYDLNEDILSKVVNNRFDLIFFRSTLNFNLNFDSLLNEINKISYNHTKIIFNFHTPTTASCLMWMFDDYTLLSLINIDYIQSLFKKNKFEIIFSKKVIFNPRKYYYNSLSKKIFYYPFYLFYLTKYVLKNLFSKKRIKLSSNEISYQLILKKN
jgi:hypothetical protein